MGDVVKECKYKAGDTLWFFQQFVVYPGEVIDAHLLKGSGDNIYEFYYARPHLSNGTVGEIVLVQSQDAYPDPISCYINVMKWVFPQVADYCDRIKTVKDIEKYIKKSQKRRGDLHAAIAADVRATEMGIEIDNPFLDDTESSFSIKCVTTPVTFFYGAFMRKLFPEIKEYCRRLRTLEYIHELIEKSERDNDLYAAIAADVCASEIYYILDIPYLKEAAKREDEWGIDGISFYGVKARKTFPKVKEYCDAIKTKEDLIAFRNKTLEDDGDKFAAIAADVRAAEMNIVMRHPYLAHADQWFDEWFAEN